MEKAQISVRPSKVGLIFGPVWHYYFGAGKVRLASPKLWAEGSNPFRSIFTTALS